LRRSAGGGAIEFRDVETIGHDCGIRQCLFDRVGEAFVKIDANWFDLLPQPRGEALEEGQYSRFLAPPEDGEQRRTSLSIARADDGHEIAMPSQPRNFIDPDVA